MKLNFVICYIQAFSLLLNGSGIIYITQAQMKDSSTKGSYKYGPTNSVSQVAERSSKRDPLKILTSKPTKYLRKGDKIVSPSGIPAVVMKKKVVIIMKGNSTVAKGESNNATNSKTGGLGYYKVKGAKINLSKQSEDSSIITKTNKNPFKNNTEIISSPSPTKAQGKKSGSTEKGDTLPPPFQKNLSDHDLLNKPKHSPAPSKLSKNTLKNLKRSSENYENGTVALVVPQHESVANDTSIIVSPAPIKAYNKKSKDYDATDSVRSSAPSKQLKNSVTALQRDYPNSENISVALHMPQPNALANETQVITPPSPAKADFGKEDAVVKVDSTIQPSSEKKSNDAFSKYTPSPSIQLKGFTLQRDSGSNGNESVSLEIPQPKALSNHTVVTTITTSPSPAKSSFGIQSSTRPNSEKDTSSPPKHSKMSLEALARDYVNVENGTIQLEIPTDKDLKNDVASTISSEPPDGAQVNFTGTEGSAVAVPNGLHKETLATVSPSPAAAPLKNKGYSKKDTKIGLTFDEESHGNNITDSVPPLATSDLVISNSTIPPSFPEPKTIENYSSITASPTPPVVLKSKMEAGRNESSFDETHETTTGDNPVLDVTLNLGMKETSENSTLILSGSEEPLNVSEASRLPTKSSKFYGNSVASTSSASMQMGADRDEYLSHSYHYASTMPPTKSKKSSKKNYGTNSISPTSVEIIDENYSLSYIYAPTAGPSKWGKKSVSLQPSSSSSQAHPTGFKGNFTPSAAPSEGENHSTSLQPSSTSPQARPVSSGNFIPTAAPTMGKVVSLSLQPSRSHSQVLPTSAGNITFTYYDDTTLAPLPVLSSEEKSFTYIGNETLNYNNYGNVTGEGSTASAIARSSIVPNTKEALTSKLPGNIDPIISLSTISSSLDDKNESTSYSTPPILDTLAAMKRPQVKGSRDWK